MRAWLQQLFAWGLRQLLALRYRVELEGIEQDAPAQGALILPNHPAETDPMLVAALLWPGWQPHPMVIEDFFHMRGLSWLFRLVGAIPMPNMEGRLGSYKKLRVQTGLDRVADKLDDGANVLMYPAGRLMRSPREELRGASAVHDLLQRRPEVPILLVRTRGLLGSRFSWYSHQGRPDLGKHLLKSAGFLLLNLLFFMPRRRITMTLEPAPADFPRHGDKMTVNGWLDAWYNRPGPEEIEPVSYLFWKRHYLALAEPAAESGQSRNLEVPDEVREKVGKQLAAIANRAPDDLRDHHLLTRDLGMDSLNIGELASWLGEEFLVFDVNVEELQTVEDVLAAAIGAIGTEGEVGPLAVPSSWQSAGDRPDLAMPDPSRTIQEHFLEACDRGSNRVAIADETSGVLTYRRAKIAVLLLAEAIRQRPERHVGVMLPASAGADLVIMAVLVAGKVPVMLNWTLGDANLEHVLKVSEVKRIITSGRFLDRLDQLNVELLMDRLWPLEELRESLTWRHKLKAWYLAHRGVDALRHRFGTAAWDAEGPAVILFTSGSESAPKGVPLTHRNVLANIQGALQSLEIYSNDVLYGFLPPFHSFGFTVMTVLPLVCGVRAAYYPNPTEGRHLARAIGGWQPTIVCGTPTFLLAIVKAAHGTDLLRSLRILLSGAEKAPEELFTQAAALCDGEILEGYGITETGPILTFNRVGEPRIGVGKPIGNVALAIVHQESREPLPPGERGLILAHGPNIFGGYLGHPRDDVFHEMDGKRWYITGDLGVLDEDGNLTISGRLKRFVKIGGEMISLPAMEEAIKRDQPDEDGVPRSAIASIERDGERPVLCLFTVFDYSVEQANALLKESGFSNLARITRHRQIEEIPLLGTGKTDYQTLRQQLQSLLDEAG